MEAIPVDSLQVAKKWEPNLLMVMRLCNPQDLQRDTCKGQHDANWHSKRF